MNTLDFKPLDQGALKLIEEFVWENDCISSVYSYFAYLIWFDSVEYAVCDNALFLRSFFGGKLRYWQPLVRGGLTVEEATKMLPPLSELFNCSEDVAKSLADSYDASSDRNCSEYVYVAEDFISMVGKRYNAKRNHIHKFRSLYNYEMLPYQASDRAEVLQFEEKWFENHNFEGQSAQRSALRERQIMFAAVDASLTGRTVCDILRVDGKIAGFSVGERNSALSATIIYEKADISYDGIYSFLAHEFAARNFSDCKYINRQEDMGLEGLRKSKLSYCPEFLIDMYALTPKRSAIPTHFEANTSQGLRVCTLGAEQFNLIMAFLKKGIASLEDKKNFLNYTDGELMEILTRGHMLGAFDGDKLVATVGVDLDRSYGDALAKICGDEGNGQYYEFSGIMVDEDFRKRGIASEICKIAIEWAKNHIAGCTLCAVVQRGNIPSLANLKRLGFELRGEAPYKEYDFLYLALDI